MKRLKELRESKGISLNQLARSINVNATTISYYENNKRKPNVEHLILLSNYFKVSIDYLCGLEENDKEDCDKLDKLLRQHPMVYDFIKKDTRVSLLQLEKLVLKEKVK